MSNHLQSETSPYLLQHAGNPVDWYPWCEEALQKARSEEKPIFLSIGYSACHWCHVMAHESFEDEEVAAILNEHFVSIKVDREERPDLDRIYMNALQAMTGTGGWPMSLFLTPEGKPFFAGTYFPPEERFGMPGFKKVLLGVVDAWKNRRREFIDGGDLVLQAIREQGRAPESREDGACTEETLHEAVRILQLSFDGASGGWGDAPKFPPPMTLEFLLCHSFSTGEKEPLHMVTKTLDAMAHGGIYDQIGGGFHRYSVDNRWLVPHFEKMLYDNAQLARVYLHAWQATGRSLYRSVAEEVLDYVLREMNDSAGGFYCAQDADSEGEEGRFYTWSIAEIRKVLGKKAESFIQEFGVTEEGNFEGRNVLEFLGHSDSREDFSGARKKLFSFREKRIPPGKDDKILTSWNGLALSAFAEAARVLKRKEYREAAERNGNFLLGELMKENGRLWHCWKEGVPRFNGFLEDHVYLIEGLLELYLTTFDPRWYQAARELTETVMTRFRAPFGFFDTSDDHESLITRPREVQDHSTPSGNAMACTVLLRMGVLAQEPGYGDLARETVRLMQPLMAQLPQSYSQWLIALGHVLAPYQEIAVIGDPGGADTLALLKECVQGFQPHRIVALAPPQGKDWPVPLLKKRTLVGGRAAAYVCSGAVCHPPVTDPQDLRTLFKQDPSRPKD